MVNPHSSSHVEVDARLPEFVGLRREVEIGLVVAPTHVSAAAAAKSLAALLDDEPDVPVRLAGVGVSSTRVHLTLAITLGTVDEVKVAGDQARQVVLGLQRIVDQFAAYDPAFSQLPDRESAEARLAEHLIRNPLASSLPTVVQQLVTLG